MGRRHLRNPGRARSRILRAASPKPHNAGAAAGRCSGSSTASRCIGCCHAGRDAGPDRIARRRLWLQLPLWERRRANRQQPRAASASRKAVRPSGGPAWLIDRAARPPFPVSRIVGNVGKPGSSPSISTDVRSNYPDVRLAYWVGGNPFAHMQDRNEMLQGVASSRDIHRA